MKDLSAVLTAHAAWLRDPGAGACADLRGADLRGADLRRANLRGANLRFADLRDPATGACADLRRANLRGANLRGANLRFADLRGANLAGADLTGANLTGAGLNGVMGDGVVVLSIHLPRYPVAIAGAVLQIGCQRHAITEWLAFDDGAIARMDSGALDWWRQWKPTIASAIAARQ